MNRCYICEARKCECPAPPPDTSSPWGAAEWLALGDYWMHVSSADALRRSYGSAIHAYDKAMTTATGATLEAARQGHASAMRLAGVLS